ncbi:MAG: 6-bladed beta-propeller [Gemmatimonadota bacterium]
MPRTRAALRSSAVAGVLIAAVSGSLSSQQQRSDTTVRMASRPVHAGVATLVPEISIGELDGAEEYLFGQIADLTVARDGSIYLFDRQVPALRKYDVNGKFVKTFGRKGQGPGEYLSGGGLGVLPDGRVLLWDTGNWRINVYSPAGELLTHWATPSGMGGNVTVVTQQSLLVDTAGFVYLRQNIRPARVEGQPLGAGRQVWIKRKADGTVVDTVESPRFDHTPRTLSATLNSAGGSASSSANVPFDPQADWAISPHGYIISGFPQRYAFEIVRSGQPIVSIRREIKADPVSAAEKKEARDRIETNMRRTDPKWSWNGPDIPGVKPFYVDLLVGQDGRIWVARNGTTAAGGFSSTTSGGGSVGASRPRPQDSDRSRITGRSTPPASPVLYDLFEPNGVYVGQLQVPARTTLYARRGDHAWGVVYDDDDVATVKRFRIAWR